MAYSLSRKAYDVRVGIAKFNKGERIHVAFGEGIWQKMGKPFYVGIKKDGDKCYFIPSLSSKVGYTRVSEQERLTYARADDVITLLDFLGEFPLRRDETKLLWYIDAADKTGYTETRSIPKHEDENPTPVKAPVKKETNMTLIDALTEAIAEKNAEWKALEVKRKEIEVQMNLIMEEMNRVRAESNAFKTALEIAGGK